MRRSLAIGGSDGTKICMAIVPEAVSATISHRGGALRMRCGRRATCVPVLARVSQQVGNNCFQMPQRVAHCCNMAIRQVAEHIGVARTPRRAVLWIKPDQPLAAPGYPFDDIGARIGPIAATIAEDDDRRL